MRTLTRSGIAAVFLSAAVAGWWLGSAQATAHVSLAPRVTVSNAAPEQLELVRWALGRFEAFGLEPPAVEIAFHADRSACEGHIAFATKALVDICTTLVNVMTRRVALHEMGHIWLDQSANDRVRERFLILRGLRSWNSWTDPWERRGFEQAAEILSWVLGERILTAQIPAHDPGELEVAFELLTGVDPSP